jgi:hypothetical protein
VSARQHVADVRDVAYRRTGARQGKDGGAVGCATGTRQATCRKCSQCVAGASFCRQMAVSSALWCSGTASRSRSLLWRQVQRLSRKGAGRRSTIHLDQEGRRATGQLEGLTRRTPWPRANRIYPPPSGKTETRACWRVVGSQVGDRYVGVVFGENGVHQWQKRLEATWLTANAKALRPVDPCLIRLAIALLSH